MCKEREEKIRKMRRKQSIKELERKWDKAKGRHSNNFWTEELLDLCAATAGKIQVKIIFDKEKE